MIGKQNWFPTKGGFIMSSKYMHLILSFRLPIKFRKSLYMKERWNLFLMLEKLIFLDHAGSCEHVLFFLFFIPSQFMRIKKD